jgi:hypothetical protein
MGLIENVPTSTYFSESSIEKVKILARDIARRVGGGAFLGVTA